MLDLVSSPVFTVPCHCATISSSTTMKITATYRRMPAANHRRRDHLLPGPVDDGLQGEALPERQAPTGGNKNGYADYLIEEEGLNDHNVVVKCADIQSAISEGATSFLFTEYQYVGVFMVAFAILIFLFLGSMEGFSTKSLHL